eukprot:CAMPEP_0197589204 /NCGR_PEP_ID=MMETSP1326-20131121/10228_1 /TAXON_ID=1155430 /ORGANISM="Genus nov. species nov., Strain RCC2288" /LENGTH=357 /DNA_ID=CAMNT_0043154117 /DNA_START=41 /DNA_END=1114 /DNA_ORIENTATION=-
MEDARYSFVVEWLDPHAGLTFRYQLLYWTGDCSIEMYDIKNRRTFLKKVKVPTCKPADLYIGATITVFSRQLKVVEYGDNFTEQTFQQQRQYTFVLVKPKAMAYLGKVVNAILKSGFTVAKTKMAVLSAADASALYGGRGDAALVAEVCSGPSVGLALVAENAVEKFADLMGDADGSTPDTIAAHFGAVCVGSASADDVSNELGFFGLPSVSRLADTTLCLVKPSAAEHLGLVLDGITGSGFQITGLQSFNLDRPNAAEFYEVYKGVVPEFNMMVDEITSGPFVAVEVAGSGSGGSVVEQFREVAGPIDPEIARVLRPDSLRAKFGFDKVRNAVHCTDLPEDGALETHYFFKILQEA